MGDSLLEEISRLHLECAICTERYKSPKILQCLHSFCTQCLINYAPKGTKTIKCPTCRQSTKVPGGDVNKLKLNFPLRSLIEDVELQEKLEKKEEFPIHCSCCDEGSEAVAFCQDCSQFICKDCKNAHDRFTTTKDHTVSLLQDLKDGKVKTKVGRRIQECVHHPDEKIAFYCVTCEELICQRCTVVQHPSPEHKHAELSSASAERQERLLGMMDDLIKVRQTFKESGENLDVLQEQVKTQITDVANQIQATAMLMTDRISEEKQRLLNLVYACKKEKEQRITEARSKCENTRKQAENAYELIKNMTDDVNDDEVLALFSTLSTKVEELLSTGPDPPDAFGVPSDFVSYSNDTGFQSNIGLGSVVTLITKFGEDLDPIDITSCPNGDLAVLSRQFKRIMIYAGEGDMAFKRDIVLETEGRRFAVTEEGLFVVVCGTKDLYVFGESSKFTATPSKSQSCDLNCIIADQKHVIVTDIANSTLYILTLSKQAVTATQSISLQMDHMIPHALTHEGSNGHLLLLDSKAQVLNIIDCHKFEILCYFRLRNPATGGLCCDSTGRIYTCHQRRGNDGRTTGEVRVHQIRGPPGRMFRSSCVCVAGLNNPRMPTFTQYGTLAVADSTGIKVFSIA
ncbi:E3 ubiquitin-protein ligase TRIM56-like [Amphiura filiformis]|uniref:E3 ubiquitin-protein ligase TRIM56-like n=1 Tax=Amphiura filiformis TaxID=82378 RepID=UPI003B20BC55